VAEAVAGGSTVPVNSVDGRPHHDTAFLGHPRGLGYLAFAEAWERFSFYGMQALLVLYMTRTLLHPGHVERIAGFRPFRAMVEALYGGPLSIQALASAIFGLYAGCVYLTPILGGLIADRLLGRTRTIIIGALSMAAGHFLMAFDVTFLAALACLIVGSGCFKGNLASQVGALYPPGDLRRADAFQIYYLGINAGVIAAPLVCGILGERVAWHYGFGAAGVGMLIAIAIYLRGLRYLPTDDFRQGTRAPRAPLKPGEGKTILLLIVLLPVLAISIVGNNQIFNAYLLWAERTIDLRFFGREMPTSWLITLDAIVSVTFLAGAVAFWRLWARRFREPGELVKLTIGCAIGALAMVVLAAASAFAGNGKVGIGWAIAFHIVNSIGFANVMPVSLALYARAAPKALASTLLGVFYFQFFAGNMLVGWLGGLLETMSGARFWLLHAALVGTAALIFALAHRVFGRRLEPEG
jgi:POT family proton-dependent oligopeptide transporter